MVTVSVACSNCQKTFARPLNRANETKKFAWKVYCSSRCQSEAKSKRVLVTCDNKVCAKTFEKRLCQLSTFNFCSRSCAVTVNNSKFPKRSSLVLQCLKCGKSFKGNKKYCSVQCALNSRRIQKEQVLKEILVLASKLGRSPTRREFIHTHVACRWFGSWNNAMLSAGLTPHRSLNQRMYKRRICIATDGHKCNSVSELIVDNWLSTHNISHIKEATYPEGKFTADWMVGSRIFVEYLGLEKDSKKYDLTTEKKRKLCKKFGLELIEIHPRDLFPKSRLEFVFLPQFIR